MENKPLEKEHDAESVHNAAQREGHSGLSQKGSPDDGRTLSGISKPPSGSSKKSIESKSEGKKIQESSDAALVPVPVRHWFVTLMCMNIPIIGWIYLIILACRRSRDSRRDFAKAYLLYKLVFLLLSLAILAVALHYGLELLDKVLTYMEML